MLGEKYFRILVLLLVHCITLILIFFKTSGLTFRLELMMFMFFLLVSIIFLFGLFFEEGWAWVLIMLFFGINILNAIFLKVMIPDNWVLFGILIVIDALAFLIAIANIGEEEEDLEIEPYESEESKKLPKLEDLEVYHHDESLPRTKVSSASASKKPSAVKPKHPSARSGQRPSQKAASRPKQSHAKDSEQMIMEDEDDVEPLPTLDGVKKDHFKDKIKVKYDKHGDKIEQIKVVRKPKKKRR